jgi:hypothetical protein
MDHTDAEVLLRSLIDAHTAAAGKTEEDLTTADLLEVSLEFYDAPCNGCNRDDGGDVMRFECGVYDWGQDQGLEVGFVRQFSIMDFAGEFSHVEELRATLSYPAALAADKDVAISVANTECTSLAEFRQKVSESAAYRLTENVPAEGLKIHQERV